MGAVGGGAVADADTSQETSNCYAVVARNDTRSGQLQLQTQKTACKAPSMKTGRQVWRMKVRSRRDGKTRNAAFSFGEMGFESADGQAIDLSQCQAYSRGAIYGAQWADEYWSSNENKWKLSKYAPC